MRSLAPFLVCLTVSAFLPSSGIRAAEPEPLTTLPIQSPSLTAALRALHTGNPEGAARDLLRVRASGGMTDSAEGHYLVGRAYLAAGKPQYAVLPLRQASRTYTALPDYALFHLGEAYLLLGRGSAAVASYERLLVDHPDSVLVPRARLRLADALAADLQYDRARDLYAQVIDKRGSGTAQPDLLVRIAECHEKAGRGADAGSVYFKVWRDWPSTTAAKVSATRLDELAKAGTKVPSRTTSEARYAHALAMSSGGNPGDALKEIDALVASRAKLPGDWRLRRALILFKKRDYKAARADLEGIAASYPAGPLKAEAMYWSARSHARLNDYASAHVVYNKLRKQYPTSSWAREALYKQGLMDLEEKNLARAIQHFELYGKTHPGARDADEALWYAGWSQFRMRKYQASEATLRRLMETYPRSQLGPRAQYWIGRGQLLSNRKETAVATLSALAREQSLTYYGMLAQGALAEAGIDFASLALPVETMPVVEPDEPAAIVEPPASESPDPATPPAVPPEPTDEVVIEQSASPVRYAYHVSRARALMRLGFQTDAALELTAARAAWVTREHKLELARLALEAEHFHGAQYIARSAFGDELGKGSPTDEIYRLAYPKAFNRFVTSYASQYKYSPSVLWAIMREESTFRPEVVSPVGAIGLLQIMPYTGQEIADGLGVKGFTADRLFDPEINIGFSAWYVRKLLEKYGGNEALAIASYNAGPEAVDRWLKQRGDLALDEFVEEIPYTETRRYVKRVLMSYGIYEAVYGKGAPRIRAGRQVERASLVGSATGAIAP